MADNGVKTVESVFNKSIHGTPLKAPTVVPPVNSTKKAETATIKDPVPAVVPAVTAAITDDEKRAKRKEDWSMAEKARAMEASATQKLREAKAYEDALANFDKNPLALAKVLKVPVDELLRKLQGAAFNIETEKVLTPEEQYKLKVMQYDQEMAKIKQDQAAFQNQVVSENYINKRIIPIITKDPDKYECQHFDGIEESAAFVYNYMNDHFQKTGKELNVVDVLDAFEEQLTEKYSSIADNFKKIKKLKNKFGETQIETAPQLGDKEPGIVDKIAPTTIKTNAEPTESELLANSGPGQKKTPKVVSSESKDPYTIIKKGTDRDARLARMAAARIARGE